MSFDRFGNRLIERLWVKLQNTPSILRSLALLIVYTVVGIALEEFGDILRTSSEVTPWDPAAGWYVVLLLSFGLRYIPVLIIISLIEAVVGNTNEYLIGIIVYSTLALIVYGGASALLVYKFDFDPRLLRLRDVVVFTVIFVFASLVVATLDISSLLALRQIELSEWISKTMHEWAGESTGIAMLAPPLLILFRKLPWLNKRLTLQSSPPNINFRLPKFRELGEWLGIFTVTVLFTWVAHGAIKTEGLDYTYFSFIPLTFIGVWKGFETTTIVVLLINITTAILVGKNIGNSDTLALQFGLMTITYIGLLLSAFVNAKTQESIKRKELEKQLRYDATHDSLTGLYNRAWFLERLEQIGQTNPENCLFAVLFLDIDRFKTVNDRFGHTVGDRLLVQIAQKLQKCLPECTSVSRLGGDEFTIILEKLTNISQVSQIAEVICQRLRQTYMVDGYKVFTTVSVGVALSSGSASKSGFQYHQETSNLLRDADIALYEAKAKGKSQYVIFDSQMYEKVMMQAQLEHDLRQAINELNNQ